MEQLTKVMVDFGGGIRGHLYKGLYADQTMAIFAGKLGEIGKLSVNLSGCPDVPETLKDNEFFVRLYGTGEIMNGPCFATGLFIIESQPFQVNFGMFQKWSLKY